MREHVYLYERELQCEWRESSSYVRERWHMIEEKELALVDDTFTCKNEQEFTNNANIVSEWADRRQNREAETKSPIYEARL